MESLDLARDYGNIGSMYDDMDKYEQVLQYYNKALDIDTELNDRVGLALGYWRIASAFEKINKNKDALEYYNKTLEINAYLLF